MSALTILLQAELRVQLHILIPAHKPMLMHVHICEQQTQKLAINSSCPMTDIIKFPPGFPPGLPCPVKTDQSRKANWAHVAT